MAGSGPEMDPDPNPDPLAGGADPDPYQSAKDLQHCSVTSFSRVQGTVL